MKTVLLSNSLKNEEAGVKRSWRLEKYSQSKDGHHCIRLSLAASLLLSTCPRLVKLEVSASSVYNKDQLTRRGWSQPHRSFMKLLAIESLGLAG